MSLRIKVAAAAAAGAAALALAGPATAAFAPAATAPVHPGVMTYTDGARCTANFVFTNSKSVYIGQAAHCSGTGGATETNGCDAASRPIGTPVEVRGASRPGRLVYNSWRTMQAKGEKDPDTCQYNDFALVKLDPADDYERTNPSVPFWGGHDRLEHHGHRAAREGALLRQLVAAWRHRAALAQGGPLRRNRGRGLEPSGLHGHPRRPGRLRQRVPRSPRQRPRRPEHARAPAAAALQRRQRSEPRLEYLEANTTFNVTLAKGTTPFRGGLLP